MKYRAAEDEPLLHLWSLGRRKPFRLARTVQAEYASAIDALCTPRGEVIGVCYSPATLR